jgi:hypothetical protein
MLALPPVTRALIIANVVVFLLQQVTGTVLTTNTWQVWLRLRARRILLEHHACPASKKNLKYPAEKNCRIYLITEVVPKIQL